MTRTNRSQTKEQGAESLRSWYTKVGEFGNKAFNDIISTNYPLSCFVSRNDVSDDENTKEPLVQVSGNPILPMGYREKCQSPYFYCSLICSWATSMACELSSCSPSTASSTLSASQRVSISFSS